MRKRGKRQKKTHANESLRGSGLEGDAVVLEMMACEHEGEESD